jgi:hypothetical protein
VPIDSGVVLAVEMKKLLAKSGRTVLLEICWVSLGHRISPVEIVAEIAKRKF